MAHLLQRKQINRLLISLVTGKNVEGADILGAIVMMKDITLREVFLDSLYAKAPCFIPILSYMILVDIVRSLLREANQIDDYRAIIRSYNLSTLYSMKIDGIAISLKSALRGHEAWSNLDFWFHCTEELIGHDVDRWKPYSSLSFDLLAMDDHQVNCILVINRIQSIVTSMHSLGVTVEIEEQYLSHVVNYFGFGSSGINILQAPTTRFISWLLDIAVVHREEYRDRDRAGTGTLEDIPQQPDKRTKAAELGYCPLQEVLFSVAHKLLGASSKPAHQLCICGRTLGCWQPLGIFEKRFSNRENLPSVLCEPCYRHILTSPLACDGTFPVTSRCVVPLIEPEPPTSFSSGEINLCCRLDHRESVDRDLIS